MTGLVSGTQAYMRLDVARGVGMMGCETVLRSILVTVLASLSADVPMVKNMKVIFMSADASTQTLEQALPLGTYGYIVKPPKPEVLQTKLEQALK